MYCPKCGKTVGAEDLYCGFCGFDLKMENDVTSMLCPCGFTNKVDDMFCRNCGAEAEILNSERAFTEADEIARAHRTLERLIVAHFDNLKNDEIRECLFKRIIMLLFRTPLYVPIDVKRKFRGALNDISVLPNGSNEKINISILTLFDSDGTEVISLFTQKEKASKNENVATILLGVREWMDVARKMAAIGTYVYINPFDEKKFVLTDEIVKILSKIVFSDEEIEESQKCKVCAAVVPNGAKFCPECGAKISAEEGLGELEPGTTIDNKYKILTTVGKGGMSIVYLAIDMRINKQWAIRQVKHSVQSIIEEIDIIKVLDHPNIPRIVEVFDVKDCFFIVSDYVEGESLSNVLKQYGALPEKTVIDFGIQICGILEYLSTQTPPIINRDIKPAAFILRPDGRLMLTDFSIARRYVPGLSKDEFQLGTSGYAAPEQYGTAQTDVRTDIYSLGRTLHQLVTGADPRNLNGVYAPIRQWNSNLSEGLEYIIEKCTQKNPADRYQTAAELEADLRNVNWLPHRREKRSLFKKLFR